MLVSNFEGVLRTGTLKPKYCFQRNSTVFYLLNLITYSWLLTELITYSCKLVCKSQVCLWLGIWSDASNCWHFDILFNPNANLTLWHSMVYRPEFCTVGFGGRLRPRADQCQKFLVLWWIREEPGSISHLKWKHTSSSMCIIFRCKLQRLNSHPNLILRPRSHEPRYTGPLVPKLLCNSNIRSSSSGVNRHQSCSTTISCFGAAMPELSNWLMLSPFTAKTSSNLRRNPSTSPVIVPSAPVVCSWD